MTFLRFLKRHRKTTIIVSLLVLITAWGAWSMRPKPPSYEFSAVDFHDIIQQVSVTGQAKPDLDVSLSFQAAGQVSKIYANVGDAVKTGQTLITLENADLLANLQQAQAAVDTESAKLAQLRAGTRTEEVAVQQVQLANANAAYSNAQNSALSAIQGAYTSSDDAVRNKADKFFTDQRTRNPKLTLTLNDMNLSNVLINGRSDIETTLTQWAAANAALTPSLIDQNVILGAKDHVLKVRTFLDNAALALSAATPNGTLTQAVIDGYKSDISTSRTNINTAVTALDSASGALSTAKSNVDLQTSNLALVEAPTLPETIAAQVATVEQRQADVRSIQANIAKTILKSPIDGTVTVQDAKAGETVTLGTSLVTVISKTQLQVEAYIPEADIAKVQVGDLASTTLDAYGDTVDFPTSVVSIDPAETVIEGVATYKTTFRFISADERVKPGMTANIDILTERKDHVLALPQRVIIRKDGGTYVQVLDSASNKPKDVFIKTGLRGSDGYTEVVSGLSTGDQVIIPTN